MSVLGLMHDKNKVVTLLMDRDLLLEESFGCHPCINTCSLRFTTKALLETVLARLNDALWSCPGRSRQSSGSPTRE